MSKMRQIQDSMPDCTYHVNVGLGNLEHSIEQFRIDLEPDYQRELVWKREQEEKFVGALLENPRAIPSFWFNWLHTDHHRSHSEVVDGKQRLQACLRWLRGEIIAHCPGGINAHIDEMNEVDHRLLDSRCMLDWNFVELDRTEVMKFYLRLNSGGTVHTDAELERVQELIDVE